MNSVVVQARKQRRYVGPKSWADVTPKQYLQYLNWQARLEGSFVGRFALLTLWYGIPYLVFKALTPLQRDSLCRLLDFTQEPPVPWLLNRIRRGGRVLVGPGTGLADLPFGAFMFAEAALLNHTVAVAANDKQRTYLVELAASLYAPRRWWWGIDPRTAFNRHKLARYAQVLSTLPDTVLNGIMLNYVGTRAAFPQRFTYLFSKKEGGGGGRTGTWLDVGLSLARSTGALGTFAQLEQQPTFLVLTMLDSLIKENEKLQERYRK